MFQGGGNIPLIMPIVGELVARGHAVRVLAGPGMRPSRIPLSGGFLKRIEAAGATYVPFAEPTTNPFDSAPPLRGLAGGWMPRRLMPVASVQARTTVWSSVWATNVTNELRRTPAEVLV